MIGRWVIGMNIQVGDVLEMKKPHPCGRPDNKKFEVMRVGMDFRLRCMACGHEIMLPRVKAEKNIRKINSLRTGSSSDGDGFADKREAEGEA